MFADDADLVGWATRQLDDDATYLEATSERARRVATLADQLVSQGLQDRRERFNLGLTGVIGAILMVLAAMQSLKLEFALPKPLLGGVVSSLGALALLVPVLLLRLAVPDRPWSAALVCAVVGVLVGTLPWVALTIDTKFTGPATSVAAVVGWSVSGGPGRRRPDRALLPVAAGRMSADGAWRSAAALAGPDEPGAALLVEVAVDAAHRYGDEPDPESAPGGDGTGDAALVVLLAAVTLLGGPGAADLPLPVARFVSRLRGADPDGYAALADPAAWVDVAVDLPLTAGDAVVLLRLALAALTASGDPRRTVVLLNLLGRLLALHEAGTVLDVLDQAVALVRGPVPPDGPSHGTLLSNAGLVLLALHERDDDPGALDEAVALLRQAREDAATDDDRDSALSNLGLALRARGDRSGSSDDLDEAVAAARAVATRTPVAAPAGPARRAQPRHRAADPGRARRSDRVAGRSPQGGPGGGRLLPARTFGQRRRHRRTSARHSSPSPATPGMCRLRRGRSRRCGGRSQPLLTRRRRARAGRRTCAWRCRARASVDASLRCSPRRSPSASTCSAPPLPGTRGARRTPPPPRRRVWCTRRPVVQPTCSTVRSTSPLRPWR